jgi:hypothetical protein
MGGRAVGCHRVLGDVDVLIADNPDRHFRRPDVIVYRCIDDDRGRWGREPIAADRLTAVASSVFRGHTELMEAAGQIAKQPASCPDR